MQISMIGAGVMGPDVRLSGAHVKGLSVRGGARVVCPVARDCLDCGFALDPGRRAGSLFDGWKA